ncbi:MAG TPA: biotin-dependent carboxyltransferase family protein [Vicinamibacterales bacterium]|nr:biotin-dependent carboxyltransferase family protein [Vicinamibacterales bacterium]
MKRRSIRIVKPGLLTTVQDEGRWGWQHLGVPVAGPMDAGSLRLANRLVGNDPRAAALEITLIGPELQFDGDVVVALTGADVEATLDGRPVPRRVAVAAAAGSILRFGPRRRGARAYLAVRGGIDVEPVAGSRATGVAARFGPLGGRPLRSGDVLPVGDLISEEPVWQVVDESRLPPLPEGGATVRLLWGPDEFPAAARERLLTARFIVSIDSNRMGYRLEGPRLVGGGGEQLSEATPIGSLQVPPSGQPILLMADRQTTGGYARIGTVITADLDLAGQLAPGDWIAFAPCDRAEAIAALRARRATADLEAGSR